LISVRSEVQVLPGPPLPGTHCCVRGTVLWGSETFPEAEGAIAQLGERVLCKHEVVGSIPSGSTTVVVLRLGLVRPEDYKFRGRLRVSRRRVLSDIVKRRSCRVCPWRKPWTVRVLQTPWRHSVQFGRKAGLDRMRARRFAGAVDRVRCRADLEASWSF
jgi:hypothetical protein